MKNVKIIFTVLIYSFTFSFKIFPQNTNNETYEIEGSNTLTEEDYAKMARGLKIPTPEEKAKYDKEAIIITENDIVPIGQLALQRLNEERVKKGKKPLTLQQANERLKERKRLIKSGATPEQLKAFDEKD